MGAFEVEVSDSGKVSIQGLFSAISVENFAKYSQHAVDVARALEKMVAAEPLTHITVSVPTSDPKDWILNGEVDMSFPTEKPKQDDSVPPKE